MDGFEGITGNVRGAFPHEDFGRWATPNTTVDEEPSARNTVEAIPSFMAVGDVAVFSADHIKLRKSPEDTTRSHEESPRNKPGVILDVDPHELALKVVADIAESRMQSSAELEEKRV